MLSKDILEKLKERYNNLHPLAFNRSVSRARSDSDLFDILDTFPKNLPVVWCDHERGWHHTSDILMSQDFVL